MRTLAVDWREEEEEEEGGGMRKGSGGGGGVPLAEAVSEDGVVRFSGWAVRCGLVVRESGCSCSAYGDVCPP